MTTFDLNTGPQVIIDRLEAVRSKRWSIRLATGLLAAAAVAFAATLVVSAVAGYWPDQPPSAMRWALLGTLSAAVAFALVWFVLRALAWRQNPAQVARHIEQAVPELRNDLINSVLLMRDKSQPSPELVAQAIGEAAHRAGEIDLSRSISKIAFKRWLAAAAVATVLLGGFAGLQFQQFQRGVLAVMHPRDYVAAINKIQLVSLEPGDTTCFAGGPLTIVAKIQNETASAYNAEVVIDGLPTRYPMLAADGYCTFTCPLPPSLLDQSFRYSVRIGQSRWPAEKDFYTVNIIKKVAVKGFDIAYAYPPHVPFKPQVKENTDGAITAPIGTKVTLTLRVSSPLPTVNLDSPGVAVTAMTPGEDGLSYRATMTVLADGNYRILMLDPAGRTLQQLPDVSNGDRAGDAYSQAGISLMKGYFHIRALSDDLPTVDFQAPGRDCRAGPGSKVNMRIHAADTYGLTSVKIFASVEKQEAKQVADLSDQIRRKNELMLNYEFDLSPYKKGDVVTYYATVTDNARKLTGDKWVDAFQPGRSAAYKITVEDAAELAAKKKSLYEDLRNRLKEVLAIQETQRINAGVCLQKHNVAASQPSGTLTKDVLDLAKAVLAGQTDIKAKMAYLVEKFPYDEDTGKLQGEIATLTNNEVTTAVEQGKLLAAMDIKGGIARQARVLEDTQDAIIEALQRLLAVMPQVAGKKSPPDKAASRPTELTPEAMAKLAALDKNLEKYIKDQKKLIDMAKALPKKPTDVFTAEDEKILNDLKAQQDNWAKFMEEAFNDFSKLAQQDFSNPVVMKEIVSVKSDVTMAKDALSKKATEIATAMEDNGVENAKSLTANIEKWLPDKPDREKWAMEDPGNGQQNTEMAELPKELEDLVGDLLEKEEDMFKEMDDITAKSMQSGDKGIGWDAADGPISNMNAQGVTGNQLPNSDELSGRSGEGRSGKSSGEFVEDKAVDKGGRRTPTRLTPEPFQKGEVKDSGTESAGGSTGGGKVSGSGGEGLEGPVPPPLAKEMKRMAGKQAQLMNKAERISAKMAPSDSANIKLLEAVTLMNRVKNDLDAFRYKNVLRSKNETLDALKQSHMLLTGKIDVTSDTTAAMPKYIMDDISDSMNGKLPEEYGEVLKQYYKRLSEQK